MTADDASAGEHSRVVVVKLVRDRGNEVAVGVGDTAGAETGSVVGT